MSHKKGKLILFTGPSGVGKATIENEIFKDDSLKLKLACSATTREPRQGEIHGFHYYFISKDEFNKKIENGDFLEWNAHFSNKYGTLKSEIERIINEGYSPLLEIETFGARNIMNQLEPNDIISIFIAPPSVNELKARIVSRGTENEEQIIERMAKVDEELAQVRHFQHVVVNDDVDRAVQEVKNIIKERLYDSFN